MNILTVLNIEESVTLRIVIVRLLDSAPALSFNNKPIIRQLDKLCIVFGVKVIGVYPEFTVYVIV